MRRLILITTVLVSSLAWAAYAQPVREALVYGATQAPDLELPTEPSYLGIFSGPKMALYKPEGAGPFPALVLLHQCGGLRSATGSWQNMAVLDWAKEAVSRGYVTLVLDSLAPRSVDTVCMGAKNGVNFPRGVRDAYQGGEHLRKMPFVDSQRVVFAGFSWGAMVGLLSSSVAWGAALSDGHRFRAVAALYPGCFEIRPASGQPYQVLNSDVDLPLLVLMGAMDTETPPQECVSRLEAIKAAGGPVEWHIYPDATHSWDSANLNGLRKTDFRGSAVQYRYNREATKDAVDRVFRFFANAFNSKP
jgi:dienelactone hydrolase